MMDDRRRTVESDTIVFHLPSIVEGKRWPLIPPIVADINPGSAGSNLYYLTNLNGTLFFRADDGTHGAELWKSDGTATGTALVADIDPGSTGSGPSDLANVNGTLFFSAADGTGGTQLWKLATGTTVYLPLTAR